ncbi:MAG TPA: hypothetical protein VJM69_01310 [Dehalococcoidia bacterium]|nr:hypothetical protein [Dehalococcoidia bacterium]
MAQEIGIREVLQQVDARMASLERHVEQRFEDIERRFDERFTAVEKRLDRLEGRMDRLEQAMLTNFRWMVGLLFTAWVTIMASVIGLGLAILARL